MEEKEAAVSSYYKEVKENSKFTFTVTAAEGWKVDTVKANDNNVPKTAKENEYEIAAVNKDTVIQVTYQELPKESEAAEENAEDTEATEAAETEANSAETDETDTVKEETTDTEETEEDTTAKNAVTFEASVGVTVLCDGADVTNGTGVAKDGKILFTVVPTEGYAITSVLADGTTEVRTTENADEYVIEGIKTDDTVVSVSAEWVGVEKEVETESETEEETEVSMPAVILTETAGSLTITVNAPEGALPEGVTMTAVPVAAETVIAAVEDQVAAEGKVIVDVVAADITFYDKDGKEIEPAAEVQVTFGNAAVSEEVQAEEATIYHIDENKAEAVAQVEPEASEAVFQAEQFSIYSKVVTASAATLSDGASTFADLGEKKVKNNGKYEMFAGDTITFTYEKSSYWRATENGTAIKIPGEKSESKRIVANSVDKETTVKVSLYKKYEKGKYSDRYVSFSITVKPKALQSVKITEDLTEMYAGTQETLTAQIDPSNLTGVTLTWGSSNEDVLTVDNNGVVTAVSEGKAVITVTATAGTITKTSSREITVKNPAESVEISGGNQVNRGETLQLTAEVTPADYDEAVKWSSSNASIASVDENGVVTGNRGGTVSITASVGGKSATKTITVVESVTITFDPNGGTGDRFTLEAIKDSADRYTFTTPEPEEYNITRAGYKFVGWSTDQNGNSFASSGQVDNPGNYNANVQVKVSKSKTYYAIWIDKGVDDNPIECYFYVATSAEKPYEPSTHGASGYFPVDETRYKNLKGKLKRAIPIANDTALIRENLLEVPTDAQIAAEAIAAKKSFDPETQYVEWYVIKKQDNGWHVDGIIRDKNKHTVTYYPNGGDTNIPGAAQYAEGTSVKVNFELVPSRNGYTFLGWDEDKDAVAPMYPKEENANFIMPNYDVDLYAIWKANENTQYKVQWYDADTGKMISTKPEEIRYAITDSDVEAEASDKEISGYTFVSNDDRNVLQGTVTADGSLVLKLYFSKNIAVSGTKTWEDNENSNGTRPASITVWLYDDGVKTEKFAVVSEGTGWAYSFANLPRYNEDKSAIVYSVQEEEVGKYSVSYDPDSYDITNTLDQVNDVTVSGTKSWVDDNNSNGTRPASITVWLYDDGVKTEKFAVVSEKTGWAYSFANLPRYNEDKSAIVYSVQEEEVEKYSVSYDSDSYDITNTLNQVNDVTVSGAKSWVDHGNSDGTRPESIKVWLYDDGEKTEQSAVVSADNGWRYTFENLPKYNDNKSAIVYTVEEEPVEGYTATYTVTETGYNIINTLKQVNNVTVSGTKSWVDDENSNRTRPESITVWLYDDGEKTKKSAVLSEETGWKYSFTNLPRYNDNKSVIVYSVGEDEVVLSGKLNDAPSGRLFRADFRTLQMCQSL